MCNIQKKKPKRSFVNSWLNDDRFKSWICKVSSDDSLFKCIVCNRNFSCNSNILRHADSTFSNFYVNSFFCFICDKSIANSLSQIYRHAESKIHRNNSKKNTDATNENLNTQDESLLSFDERKKYAEIRYALITEKNIPHHTAKEILNFFQKIGKDHKVLKSISMSCTKCKNIISNVLYSVETKRVVNNIQNNKFSIFINETSDICNKKWMMFIVRYVDPETLDVRSQLVKLINIDARDCSTEKLLHSNLKSLAVHAACAKMPALCEEFLRNITTYIYTSPKRSDIFNEFVECFQDTNRKILKIILLESWDTIKYFLNETVVNDQSKSAEHLLSIMENVDTKVYFLFLKYVLNFLNQFNAFFQAIETRIHLLQLRSVNFLIKISQNFIKPDLLKHLLLVKEKHADVTNIRQNCLQFYIIAAEKIRKRLPVNDAFLYKLKVFQPQTSLFDDNREISFNDVFLLQKTLGGFDENKILKRQFNDIPKYPNLKSLLNVVRSLPNSNADPERAFSILSDLKTKNEIDFHQFV
ncbi:hypothetical protein ACFW04_014212 [Cataglyphis niger]